MNNVDLFFLMIGLLGCILIFNKVVDDAVKDDRIPDDMEEVYVDEDGNEIDPPVAPPGDVEDGYHVLEVVVEQIGPRFHAYLQLPEDREAFLVNDEDFDALKDDVTRILQKKYPDFNLRIRFYQFDDEEESEQ